MGLLERGVVRRGKVKTQGKSSQSAGEEDWKFGGCKLAHSGSRESGKNRS